MYDEKCKTKYEKHCKVTEKCVHIYKTMCTQYGYEQRCQQVNYRTVLGYSVALFKIFLLLPLKTF